MSTHRYVWHSVNLAQLVQVLPPGAVPTIVAEGPERIVDIDLADDNAKSDLDDAMAELGWAFVQTSPTTPVPLTTRQLACVQVTSDVSVSGAAFVQLLSIDLTTGAGFVAVHVGASVTTSVTAGFLRLVVDGVPVPQQGGGLTSIGTAGVAFSARAAVSAAMHTFSLQWRSDVGGTLFCRPITFPDAEHCSLEVVEIW